MGILINLVRKFLEAFHFVTCSDVTVRFVSRHPNPEQIRSGEMLIVRDKIDKWLCFHCPDGCGEIIKLPLNPRQRPRWGVSSDWLRRPTVNPSVRQTSGCKSHFWVRKGKIDWCGDSGNSA